LPLHTRIQHRRQTDNDSQRLTETQKQRAKGEDRRRFAPKVVARLARLYIFMYIYIHIYVFNIYMQSFVESTAEAPSSLGQRAKGEDRRRFAPEVVYIHTHTHKHRHLYCSAGQLLGSSACKHPAKCHLRPNAAGKDRRQTKVRAIGGRAPCAPIYKYIYIYI
jgi:hypothetical protein